MSGQGARSVHIGLLVDPKLRIERSVVQQQIGRELARLRERRPNCVLVYVGEQREERGLAEVLCVAQEVGLAMLDVSESGFLDAYQGLLVFGAGDHHESLVLAARSRGKQAWRVSESSEVLG